MLNCLMLSGTVCTRPITKISPSGIPHFQFVLEHSSKQIEANFYRQAWCRIPVIISGKDNQAITKNIFIGVQITVQGFISCHKFRNGLHKMVIHTQEIKIINSGD